MQSAVFLSSSGGPLLLLSLSATAACG